jgi:hypothetical protein
MMQHRDEQSQDARLVINDEGAHTRNPYSRRRAGQALNHGEIV